MTQDLQRINTVLISVSDKQGLAPFAQTLHELDIEILATGGTYATLKGSGIPVQRLEEYVKYPEMLDGRVKTLQPEVFAGILARRVEAHLQQLKEHKLKTIDMVVCNFYPFEHVASKEDAKYEEFIENIDIGGPSLVRAAAKNHQYVAVIPSPKFYDAVAEELKRCGGSISLPTRQALAQAALGMVAAYDVAIYNGLRRFTEPKMLFPERFFLSATKYEDAKYGENPDQKAAVYRLDGYTGMADWRQLAGETRSFNNYLDIGKAYEILEGFEDHPAAATVKHGHISGFAFAPTLAEAYSLAHGCDPEADFGCTTVLNRVVDVKAARLIGKNLEDDLSVYTEIVIAPSFDSEALEILKAKQKRKMRLIEAKEGSTYPYDLRLLEGILLVQDRVDYRRRIDRSILTYPTTAKPDEETFEKLLASWELVRKVESNGIVICDGRFKDGRLTHFWTYGVGSFRKRNGAVRIALENAGERARGAVAASDGFFPFRDSVDMLAGAGVKAVIQPGGSIGDDMVVKAADEYGMPMVFTHTRAFKH